MWTASAISSAEHVILGAMARNGNDVSATSDSDVICNHHNLFRRLIPPNFVYSEHIIACNPEYSRLIQILCD